MAFDEASMNLLMQYLSSAGMDIGAGKPLGANVNAVTQQQVAARSYANLLKGLLSNGGKMTVDGQNMQIKAPVGAFQSAGGPGAATPLAAPQENIGLRDEATGTAGVPTAINQVSPTPKQGAGGGLSSSFLQNLLLGGNVSGNPSPSPLENLSGAALAGLTPQDISQALRLKMAQDEMGESKVNNVLSRIQALQQIRMNEAKLNAPEKVDMTSNMKEYQLALAQGYKGSFEDWVKSPDGMVKQYEYAVKQGYDKDFTTWKRENASAGATRLTIENKIDERKQLSKIAGQLHFAEGKDTAQVKDYVNSKAFRSIMLDAPDDPVEAGIYKVEQIGKFYESLFTSYGAKSVDALSFDHKSNRASWRVTWQDGTTEVITRALNN
jgi:hypothetical protein